MAKIIYLPQFIDTRGELTVVEKLLPYEYKRVKIIKNPVGIVKGNNQTLKAHQAILCISGGVDVIVKLNEQYEYFALDATNKCLLLEPKDWYQLENFKENTILLLVSNQEYDANEFVAAKQSSSNGFSTSNPSFSHTLTSNITGAVV